MTLKAACAMRAHAPEVRSMSKNHVRMFEAAAIGILAVFPARAQEPVNSLDLEYGKCVAGISEFTFDLSNYPVPPAIDSPRSDYQGCTGFGRHATDRRLPRKQHCRRRGYQRRRIR